MLLVIPGASAGFHKPDEGEFHEEIATHTGRLLRICHQCLCCSQHQHGLPAELESIIGIGPAKSKAIIDYRTRNSTFKTVDDLDNVKGFFGKKSIDKMRSNISLSGATTVAAKVATTPANVDDKATTKATAEKKKVAQSS